MSKKRIWLALAGAFALLATGCAQSVTQVTTTPSAAPIDRWAGWPAPDNKHGGPHPQFMVVLSCGNVIRPYREIQRIATTHRPADYVEVRVMLSTAPSVRCMLSWQPRAEGVQVIGLRVDPPSVVWLPGSNPMIVKVGGHAVLLITMEALGGNPPEVALDANGTPMPQRPDN